MEKARYVRKIRSENWILFWAVLVAVTLVISGPLLADPVPPANVQNWVERFCGDCHDSETRAGGIDLLSLRSLPIEQHAGVWERVVKRLETRQMPPPDAVRPDVAEYRAMLESLTVPLDRAASENPRPGRPPALRRLTRFEYQNAIRDLLHLEVDATAWLPPDESSHGFDNVTVGELSPTRLERYLVAAEKISRLAVGRTQLAPTGDTIRMRPDVTQEEHVPGLPIGTRGGTSIRYTFPQDGQYEIQVRLARDRNEEVEGLYEAHELQILMDRTVVKSFTVEPPPGRRNFATVDEHLKVRCSVSAGPHDLGVTFVKFPSSLLETKRQPYQAHFNMHRHPRRSPAVYQVSVTGPWDARAAGDTPSRRRILVSYPRTPDEDEACADAIFRPLLRRAYRRPVTDEDVEAILKRFREARSEQGFEAGVEMGLNAVLVHPSFLFRIEQNPDESVPKPMSAGVDGGGKILGAEFLNSVDLASRLSFFLWSSIPDDELLDVAERGELVQASVLESQTRRMLADSRARSLVTNFAAQWLHLRNLDTITPDLRLFPDFDDNLRQAFRLETEHLVERIVRDDSNVLELLSSNRTYLNERLAKHYGIPHVYGSRFRLVNVEDHPERTGLMGHGSFLTVTSYATRTSPVIRGKWVLENLIGTPPPPPPANVPALKDNTVSSQLSVRERLAEHRRNEACAGCHRLMDPVGLTLENFDAVGRFRQAENGQPIDVSGGLPDGREFQGEAGLRQAIGERPELFVRTLTEKLMTYAIGRGLEPVDGAAVRRVVREAGQRENRFSSLVVGIVQSTPFRMRTRE